MAVAANPVDLTPEPVDGAPDPVDVATGVLMERHQQGVERASAMLIDNAAQHGLEVREYATWLLGTFGGAAATGEPAVVRRAVEFIDANAHRAIGIADVAEAAGIGPRGVQAAFRQHRNQTPLEYLRQVRMENAHRDLLAAHPTRGDTVNDIAARWGFTNPGRFSVAYRQLIGCSPSRTLRG